MHDDYFRHDDAGLGLEEAEYDNCTDPTCWCNDPGDPDEYDYR